MNKKIVFTTWERFQFDYLERQMGRKFTLAEKVQMVIHFGWRDYLLKDKNHETLGR